MTTLDFPQLTIHQLSLFAQKFVIAPSGCWLWSGHLDKCGYGRFKYANRAWLAHQISLTFRGEGRVDGLEVDHLCKNRACVNPKHLEQVSHRTNTLRGDTIPATNRAKTRCKNGHEFNAKNTYIWKPKNMRQCRVCNRLHKAKNPLREQHG